MFADPYGTQGGGPPPPAPGRRRRPPPADLINSGLIPAGYANRYHDVEADYGRQMAGYADDERNLFRDYGMRGVIDPATGQTTYEVDPTARFGKFQEWLGGVAGGISSARADSVARGLKGGGLANRRADLAKHAAVKEQGAMFNQLQQGATGIHTARGDALTAKNRGFRDINQEALDWWAENGPEDEGIPDPSSTPPPYLPPPGPSPQHPARGRLARHANRIGLRPRGRRR